MKPFSKKIITFAATAAILGSLSSAKIFDDSHLDEASQKQARADMQVRYAEMEARDSHVASSFSNVVQSAIKRDWDNLANHVERSVDLFQKRDLIQDEVLGRKPMTMKKRSIVDDHDDEHAAELHRRAEDAKMEFGNTVRDLATSAVERDWDQMAHQFKRSIKTAQELRLSRRAIQDRRFHLEKRDLSEADDEEDHHLLKREIEVDPELNTLHSRFENDLSRFGSQMGALVERGLALDYNALPKHFKRAFNSGVTLYKSRSVMQSRRNTNKKIVRRALAMDTDEEGVHHARDVHARSVSLGEHIDNMVDAATKRDWDSFVFHGKRGIEEGNGLRLSRRDWKWSNPFVTGVPLAKRDAHMEVYTRSPNDKVTFGSSMGGIVDSLMNRDFDKMSGHVDSAVEKAKRYVEVQNMIKRQQELKGKALSWVSRKIDSESLGGPIIQKRDLSLDDLNLQHFTDKVKREFEFFKRVAAVTSPTPAPVTPVAGTPAKTPMTTSGTGLTLGAAMSGLMKAVAANDKTSAVQYMSAILYNLAGKKKQKDLTHPAKPKVAKPAAGGKKRSIFDSHNHMLKHKRQRLA